MSGVKGALYLYEDLIPQILIMRDINSTFEPQNVIYYAKICLNTFDNSLSHLNTLFVYYLGHINLIYKNRLNL